MGFPIGSMPVMNRAFSPHVAWVSLPKPSAQAGVSRTFGPCFGMAQASSVRREMRMPRSSSHPWCHVMETVEVPAGIAKAMRPSGRGMWSGCVAFRVTRQSG